MENAAFGWYLISGGVVFPKKKEDQGAGGWFMKADTQPCEVVPPSFSCRMGVNRPFAGQRKREKIQSEKATWLWLQQMCESGSLANGYEPN